MSRKNPFKGAIILTIIAAVTGVLGFVLSKQIKSSDSSKDKASLIFPDLKRDDFLSLTLRTPVIDNQKPGENELQLKRLAEGQDQWIIIAGDKTYPADTASVNGIISTIISARADSKLKDIDLKEIKLEPEKMSLEFETKQGKKKILLGEDTAIDYYVYARVEGESQVILTSRSLRFSVDKKLGEIREKRVIKMEAPEISSLRLVSSGREELNGFTKLNFVQVPAGNVNPLNGNKENQITWIAEEPLKVTLDPTEVEALIASLSKMSVKGFFTEEASEKKKLPFNSPLITLEITRNTGDTKKSIWKLVSAPKPGNPKERAYYLSEDGKDSVYEVNESIKQVFKTNLFRFRKKSIAKFDKKNLGQIQITRGDVEINLQKSAGDQWTAEYKDAAKSYSGPAKKEHVDAILDRLANIEALQYLDTWDSRKLGLDAPSAIINIRGKAGDPSTDLANLFFGNKIDATQVVVRKENMEAAAGVSLDLDFLFPKDPSKFLEKIPEVDSKEGNEPDPSAPAKKESTMLQPTVSDLKQLKKLPAPIVKPGHKYRAVITLTDGRVFEVDLAAAEAPYTVSNFIHLARNRFYDNVKFHRVIANFVIQGGDPTGTGRGGPGWMFDNENNNLKHVRGALSMAHAGPNTNGSQFFIVLAPQGHLDGEHTVFGKLKSGMELLDGVKQGDTMKKVEVFEEAL